MPRRTTWEDTAFAVGIATGAQQLTALDGVLSQADAQGLTLTRMIIDLSCFSSTVAGAWGVQRLALGVGIASREALAASAVPDPNTDTEEPPRGWVWKTTVAIAQNGIGTPVVTARIMVDNRAKRRLDSGRLYIALNNDAELGTTFAVRIIGNIRALFLLP